MDRSVCEHYVPTSFPCEECKAEAAMAAAIAAAQVASELYWAEMDLQHYREALELIRDQATTLEEAQSMAEDGLGGADREPFTPPTVGNYVV